ncbi:MAG: hypothetical protein WCF65_01305 [Parachlamydiaceae bacterium]
MPGEVSIVTGGGELGKNGTGEPDPLSGGLSGETNLPPKARSEEEAGVFSANFPY